MKKLSILLLCALAIAIGMGATALSTPEARTTDERTYINTEDLGTLASVQRTESGIRKEYVQTDPVKIAKRMEETGTVAPAGRPVARITSTYIIFDEPAANTAP